MVIVRVTVILMTAIVPVAAAATAAAGRRGGDGDLGRASVRPAGARAVRTRGPARAVHG